VTVASITADVPDELQDEAEATLIEFFRVQGAIVAEHLADLQEDDSKSARRRRRKDADLDEVFDQAVWDRVLMLEILAIALAVSAAAGRSIMAGLGLAASDYDVERTRAWMEQHASGVASGINGTTRVAVQEALDAGLSPGDVRELFDQFAQVRGPQIAQTEITASTGFGTQEAGRQSGQDLTKTWVTGRRPRASHARINGQTVPLRGRFGNNARWPGDSVLPVRERARCNCSMTINTA
jgi:hypothetical protein